MYLTRVFGGVVGGLASSAIALSFLGATSPQAEAADSEAILFQNNHCVSKQTYQTALDDYQLLPILSSLALPGLESVKDQQAKPPGMEEEIAVNRDQNHWALFQYQPDTNEVCVVMHGTQPDLINIDKPAQEQFDNRYPLWDEWGHKGFKAQGEKICQEKIDKGILKGCSSHTAFMQELMVDSKGYGMAFRGLKTMETASGQSELYQAFVNLESDNNVIVTTLSTRQGLLQEGMPNYDFEYSRLAQEALWR